MKKLSILFVLVFLSSSVFAQSFFVKAGIGGGVASSSFKMFNAGAYALKNMISSGQANVTIGFAHGNWQVETGIGFLKTGATYVAAHSGSMTGAPLPEWDFETFIAVPVIRYTINNYHLVLPLTSTYMFKTGSKISFGPGAGIMVAYNFRAQTAFDGLVQRYYRLNEPEMRYRYNRVSALAVLKFDVQYKVSKQLSVWVSPSYQHMLTSLTTMVPGDNMSRIYDHAMLLNVGVRYDLNCSGHYPFQCAKTKAQAD